VNRSKQITEEILFISYTTGSLQVLRKQQTFLALLKALSNRCSN